MNEQEFSTRLARRLEDRLDDLPPTVMARLRAAREAALAQVPVQAQQLAFAGAVRGTTHRHGGLRFVPLAALVLGLTLSFYWYQVARQATHHQDAAEIDAQVLTDDLPIAAYVDQGFEAWLKHTQPSRP